MTRCRPLSRRLRTGPQSERRIAGNRTHISCRPPPLSPDTSKTDRERETEREERERGRGGKAARTFRSGGGVCATVQREATASAPVSSAYKRCIGMVIEQS